MCGAPLALLLVSLDPPLGLDRYIPAPASNPMTAEKAALGRRLFFAKELSADGTLACASCHEPAKAFADDKPIAVGIGGQLAGRRSPRIVNRAWGRSFFWDGRVPTLEEQVLQPMLNPKEMGMTLDRLMERASSLAGRKLDAGEISRALATYVRTILAGDSPYDRYMAGEAGALSAEAVAGLKLFRGKANCIACHLGPNLTDETLHDTGVAEGSFKTPSLRQVAEAPPYMHDGSLKTLEAVVDFYDEGGRAKRRLDAEMRKLGLTAAEKKALVAFLRSLSGRVEEGWR